MAFDLFYFRGAAIFRGKWLPSNLTDANHKIRSGAKGTAYPAQVKGAR